MLVPPAARAPRCDAASMPLAAPLTTQAPDTPEPGADAHGHLVAQRRTVPGAHHRHPVVQVGEPPPRDIERDRWIVQELEERGQVFGVDGRDESCPALRSHSLHDPRIERASPLLVGVAAGRARSDRRQTPFSAAFAPGELVQLVGLDTAKRGEHEQGVASPGTACIPVGEPGGTSRARRGTSERRVGRGSAGTGEPLLDHAVAIRERFGDMVGIDDVGTREIGDGAGDLDRPIETPARETELVDGAPEQPLGIGSSCVPAGARSVPAGARCTPPRDRPIVPAADRGPIAPGRGSRPRLHRARSPSTRVS